MNEHLGFNPRSQANSDALSDFVVADLRQACHSLAAALESGNLNVEKNPTVFTAGGVRGRSIDLVLHERAAAPAITVCISVEHKTIMTAHGKARLNRYGDLIAYSNHMHNHRRECIAGGIVVVNVSPVYENPDSFAKGLRRPNFKMPKVVADTVKIFAEIPLRNESSEPSDRPEAIGVIVVDYDGVNPAKLVAGPLAPQPDSAIHYHSFIRRISDLYVKRFSAQ
ncbi:MAG: hypothetical protein HY238_20060 [Acidobacteria bacterium]|nr:hypothetical protein [Acidobacteriota bacterium]